MSNSLLAGASCCGCGVCQDVCPWGCITMIEDEEGFSYPQIDKNTCKNCGKCMKLGCPAISRGEKGIVIDKTQCVGCEVCVAVCPFDCLKKESE